MIHLHNTLGRQKEVFKPQANKKVSLYVCGLTVYSHPHIGNWVAYIYWDVLRRVLTANSCEVTHVQNITDVGHLTSDEDAGEDKMLAGALKEGKTAWEIAEKYIKIADDEAFGKLGLLRPAHMPRATEFIPQQIAFIQELENKGFTYRLKDGIYFDTGQLSDYGKLAKLDAEGLKFGARVENSGKKNATDFAVWKFSPAGKKRDMEWDSPWGKGFPGWHLECSVMARELLGDTLDIHTGGVDHIPIHHSNEIAQSEALTGKPLANFWLHANHMKVDGTKMSKSLGNLYTLPEIEQRGYSLQAFKLMVLSKHYRTEGNFTWDILDAAQNRLNHWLAVADLRWQIDDSTNSVHSTKISILDRLSDDLDTPGAIAVIDGLISSIETGKVEHRLGTLNVLINQLNELLGIDIGRSDITDEQKHLLAKRLEARSKGEWDVSDKIREQLLTEGVEIKDLPKGQIWSKREQQL